MMKLTRKKEMKRSSNEEDEQDEMHCLLSTLDYCSVSVSTYDLLHRDCLQHAAITLSPHVDWLIDWARFNVPPNTL